MNKNNTITVNSNSVDWEKDLTIELLLKKLNYTFRMLVIKVNDELIKKDQYSSYIVPENADVQIIHLISGG